MKYPMVNYAIVLQIAFAILTTNSFAAPVGTGFSYQGKLGVAGNGANGSYDLRLSLRDALTGGLQLGTSVTNQGVSVSNGLFTTTIDFGPGIFTGQALWLEIGVRTNGVGAFTTLTPRQSLTPTPYAVSASSLSGTLPATQLTGTLPAGALGGTYSGAVAFNNSGNAFSGSGSGLSGVNASTLGGFGPGSFWKLLGNGGTTSANFLGTTDKQSLELRVDNIPGFRLQTTFFDIFNVVAGYGCNAGDNLVYGAAIGGGISNSIFRSNANPAGGSTISGGEFNEIFGSDSTITGGSLNRIRFDSGSCTISGGAGNTLQQSVNTAIGGGAGNQVIGGFGCVISGGGGNVISNPSGPLRGATISGGESNLMYEPKDYPTIGGGYGNQIYVSSAAVISGGKNIFLTNASASSVGGGSDNSIVNSSVATISGGSGNFVFTADSGTVAGGSRNQLGLEFGGKAPYSAIGGGLANFIYGAENASISGGASDIIRTGAGYVACGILLGRTYINNGGAPISHPPLQLPACQGF